MDTFGQFVKSKRLELGLGLREFCQRVPVDPSNFSKVERGRLEAPAPDSPQFTSIASILGIEPGSADFKEMEMLASCQRGEIPAALLENQSVAAKLPAFFRTLDGSPISEEERNDLIRMIQDA